MEAEVKDNQVDLRRFVTPLTGIPATEDPYALNLELEKIIRMTKKKPMAVLVSLSFPPPAPYWLQMAREHSKSSKIIQRHDLGFWSGTNMQQQFVNLLNLARCMEGLSNGYIDETYTTQLSKLLTLEEPLCDLPADLYAIDMMSAKMALVKAILAATGWEELPDQKEQWDKLK